MKIEAKLAEFIKKNNLFSTHDLLLLGVSGGKDSMLMAYLLQKLGYSCMIAHCNFQLRSKDSDDDEAFVRKFAKENNIPFFSKRFDTSSYAKQNGMSIQMAARELRYDWFEKIRQEENCDIIAIAHHQQDNIETVFLNLTRGTGLQGLQGIAVKRETIVRPMLYMTSTEIEHAVNLHQIAFRDDQSNFSTKYARNKVRLDILPKFREIQNDFDQIMQDNIDRFKESYELLQQFVTPIRLELFIEENHIIKISKKELGKYKGNLPLLYEIFRPYFFEKNILSNLQKSWENESGLLFESPSFELLLDRDFLFLRPKKNSLSLEEIHIEQNADSVQLDNGQLTLTVDADKRISSERIIAKIDIDKLVFPLRVRKWHQGDYFIPLGMIGRQKLSDFFIHQKLSNFDKENVRLIINGNGDIIWIIGHRIDNRYKITENTDKVITFVYQQQE